MLTLTLATLAAAAMSNASDSKPGPDDDPLGLTIHTVRSGPNEGARFQTGIPITFHYARNTEPAPYCGPRFAQDAEPAGRFMVLREVEPEHLPPGWIHGILTLNRPIVLSLVWPVEYPDGSWGEYKGREGWKRRLSEAFDGLTGTALSRAILAAGYDGVVTISMSSPRHEPGYTSEIVDLTAIKPHKPHQAPVK